MPRKVLYATDFSRASLSAFPAALAAIETCFTRLHEAALWKTRRNSIAAALREAS